VLKNLALCPQIADKSFVRLLDESHVICAGHTFGAFLNWPVLCLKSRNIFAQRSPDAFRVPRADDHAAQQFALRPVGENVHKIERKFLRMVVNHYQIAVDPLQLFFIGFDLNLAGLRRGWLLFIVHFGLRGFLFKIAQGGFQFLYTQKFSFTSKSVNKLEIEFY
jgi:hypothetical protein